MEYRELGKTGKLVSVLGFGCMRLPILGGTESPTDIFNPEKFIDEEEAARMIEYAFEHGVNYFDTAYRYHGGQSEVFLGRALGPIRKRIMLTSKLPVWMVKSGDDFDRILDEQLARLATDHLDFYLLHGLTRKHWETVRDLGVLEFLERAAADGRVGHTGFSFHDDIGVFREIVDSADWDMCQIQYNYYDEDYQAGREGLEYASSKGIGVVVMEPLRGGKLVDRVPEDVMDAWNAAPVSRSPVEWAFRWVWDQPRVSMALSGMSSMDQLVENIEIAGEAEAGCLTEAERDIIRRVRGLYRGKMKVDCTSCAYCMPCPSGVNIPENFSLYNDLFMFKDGEISIMFYNQMLPPGQRALNCIECGRCETLCPQKIPIIEELKKAHAALRQES